MNPPTRHPPTWKSFVATLAVTLLAFFAALSLLTSPTITGRQSVRFDEVFLSLVLHSIFPVGVTCAIQSWRFSRANIPAEMKNEAAEFLLGATGFVFILLGAWASLICLIPIGL